MEYQPLFQACETVVQGYNRGMPSSAHKKSAVFVVHSDFDALEKKGVLPMIAERTEDGFLDRAVTVHAFTDKERVIDFAPGLPIHELKLPQSGNRIARIVRFVFHLIRSARYIRRLATQERALFVRAQDPYYSGLIGWLATRWPRKPFCISIHADYDKMESLTGNAPRIFGSRALAKRIERFLLSQADRVLVISKYIEGYAHRNGAKKTAMFRHLPPPANTVQRALDNPPLISFVSRLSREKHCFDIIELAAQLTPPFQIAVAGDGPERTSMETEIQKRGLSGRVQLLGFVGKDEVLDLRSRSTVCVCLIDGMSLLEAAASGRPVIAYDNEWHGEVIRDGVNGILVQEGDVTALADAVKSVLQNERLADRLVGNMLQTMTKNFSPEALRAERVAAYSSI